MKYYIGLSTLLLPSLALANWGDKWGEMQWGVDSSIASEQIPLDSGWSVLIFGVLLVMAVSAVKSKKILKIFPVVMMCLLPLTSDAAELVAFENGEVADADDVNANFQALNNEIAALKAQVAVLESLNLQFQRVDDVVTIPAESEVYPVSGNHVIHCPSGWVAIDGAWGVNHTLNVEIQTMVNVTSKTYPERRLFKLEVPKVAFDFSVDIWVNCARISPLAVAN